MIIEIRIILTASSQDEWFTANTANTNINTNTNTDSDHLEPGSQGVHRISGSQQEQVRSNGKTALPPVLHQNIITLLLIILILIPLIVITLILILILITLTLLILIVIILNTLIHSQDGYKAGYQSEDGGRTIVLTHNLPGVNFLLSSCISANDVMLFKPEDGGRTIVFTHHLPGVNCAFIVL